MNPQHSHTTVIKIISKKCCKSQKNTFLTYLPIDFTNYILSNSIFVMKNVIKNFSEKLQNYCEYTAMKVTKIIMYIKLLCILYDY